MGFYFPRDARRGDWTAAGILGENFSPASDASSFTLTGGTVYVSLVPARGGDVISKVGFHLVTAGGGTVPTNILAGLATSAGTMVAVTAELKDDVQWTAAANTEVRFALTASYTVPSSGGLYVVLLKVGTWGTTEMAVARSGAVQMSPFSGSILRWGTAGTGKTGLPAVAAALDARAAASTPMYAQIA